ncbi:MAG: hypothetical protein ABJN98_23430 [Roseibium sp.]
MTPTETVSLCAQNNALWCDAVLSVAGARTKFHNDYWFADGKQLPLYPNLVTLNNRSGPDLISALKALPLGAAVKDSFDCLELKHRGFEKLFGGTWLFRPAQSSKKPPVSSDWQKVMTLDAFGKWLPAWNANETLHHVFSPKLIKAAAIEFAMIMDGEAIKAGCTLNQGPKCDGKNLIGLSNVFYRKKWLYGALRSLLEPYSHHPVCTYESDEEILPVYRQLGFQDCGDLAIWVKVKPQDS